MVTIMAHPVRMQVEVISDECVWLNFFEHDEGQVQVYLGNLPPKIREGLIALAKEQTA